jgi:hypothetical protein
MADGFRVSFQVGIEEPGIKNRLIIAYEAALLVVLLTIFLDIY